MMVRWLTTEAPEAVPSIRADLLEGIDASPQALDEHKAPIRQRLSPSPKSSRWIRKGPKQVPLHHGVEAVWRTVSGSHQDLDLEPFPPSSLLEALEHLRGKVQGGDFMTETGRDQAEEPGSGADVEHSARHRRQQPAERSRPSGQHCRATRVVAPRVVVRGCVRIPKGP